METSILGERDEGGIHVVELGGRLDAFVASAVKDRLVEMIAQGHPRLLLNLTNVSFMDSAGVSVVVTAQKTAAAADGEVILSNLTQAVRAIFELTRLNLVFRIYEDEASALKSAQAELQA